MIQIVTDVTFNKLNARRLDGTKNILIGRYESRKVAVKKFDLQDGLDELVGFGLENKNIIGFM